MRTSWGKGQTSSSSCFGPLNIISMFEFLLFRHRFSGLCGTTRLEFTSPVMFGNSLKVEPISCGVWVCQSHMSVIISQQSLYLHVCCYAGTMAGGSTPFSWQESNQVSALIWVSLLSSAEPWGIQLLSHYAIHLRLYSANVCVAFSCLFQSGENESKEYFQRSIVNFSHKILPRVRREICLLPWQRIKEEGESSFKQNKGK